MPAINQDPRESRPHPKLDAIVKLLDRAEAVAVTFAAIAIFLIMIVVVIDVVLRYFFNSPLAWAYEFVGIYLMGVAFFFGVSDTLRRNHHVNVDILYMNFSLTARRAWKLIAWLLTSVMFAMMFAVIARTAWNRWQNMNVVAGEIPWPTWVPAAVAAVGLALILIRLVIGTFALGMVLVQGGKLASDVAGDDVAEPKAPEELHTARALEEGI